MAVYATRRLISVLIDMAAQWVFMGEFIEQIYHVRLTNPLRIYKEIGPGKRIALSKLALEKFEETGRPLRIAIDTSIWLFQIQASKGETSASRTNHAVVNGRQAARIRPCEPFTIASYA